MFALLLPNMLVKNGILSFFLTSIPPNLSQDKPGKLFINNVSQSDGEP